MSLLQPYYMLDFNASACFFEIRVNDYPVINMNIPGQLATSIPINYAILKSGIQDISMTILPINGKTTLDPDANLKFNIKLFDVSADFSFVEQFGDFRSIIIDNKKLPIQTYSNTFNAEVPYLLEAWSEGVDLKEVKDCREKLNKAYLKIIKSIETENFEDFKKYLKKREGNMAVSMYLSSEESTERINDLLQDFKNGFKINSNIENSLMILGGHNKIAMLKKPNGEPALSLENKETEEELMSDISFYIPEGKEDFEVI